MRLQAELLQLPIDEVQADPTQAFLQIIQLINGRIQALAEGQEMGKEGENLLQILKKYDISLSQSQEGLFQQFQQLMETIEPNSEATEDENTTQANPEALEVVQRFSSELHAKLSAENLPSDQTQKLNDLLQEVAQKLSVSDDMDAIAQHLENQVVAILGLETQEEKDQKAMEEYRAIARQSIAKSLAKHGFKPSSD